MTVPRIDAIPEVPKEVLDAALDGRLVFFVGAGVSQLAGLPGWDEWASGLLDKLRVEEVINFAEFEQLTKVDAKKKLTIAKLLAKKAKLKLDFAMAFRTSKSHPVFDHLKAIGCPVVTTNYDELVLPSGVGGNAGTPALGKRYFRKDELLPTHLSRPGNVLHLHGSVSAESDMVITTETYLSHYGDDYVTRFLEALFSEYTVVFAGYGLAEAEILEHLLRKGKATGESKLRPRFMLEAFFVHETPLYSMLQAYYEESFGISLLGYERDRKGFEQLETVLRHWAHDISFIEQPLSDEFSNMMGVLANE